MLDIFHTLILGVIAWFMLGALLLPLMGLLWSFVRTFLTITTSSSVYRDTIR